MLEINSNNIRYIAQRVSAVFYVMSRKPEGYNIAYIFKAISNFLYPSCTCSTDIIIGCIKYLHYEFRTMADSIFLFYGLRIYFIGFHLIFIFTVPYNIIHGKINGERNYPKVFYILRENCLKQPIIIKYKLWFFRVTFKIVFNNIVT